MRSVTRLSTILLALTTGAAAARAGGFHYKFDGQHWQDTKGAGELFAHLSREASAQAGLALDFTA